ncbi:AsnC family transcriptional regulator [Candidatus Woesearchaeota archaeon]|nr:AsnC family transcriptional regulator [Candidatus Woesearchaeota archaeon]|tara:strand:+ start:1458 stop:1907 length:450 start_codon:yes stop_codon:yes gene_type:complete
MKLSNTDKKILNILIENSRLSLRQIAKKAKVSVATVMHHLKKLEQEQIITKYTLMMDYEKLGYDVEAAIEMRISKAKSITVLKKIAFHPNIFGVYDITGDFDALVLARFPTRKKLDEFLKKIQSFDFVERIKTMVILNTIKEEKIGVEL